MAKREVSTSPNVVITGASRGLGAATALACARLGASVVLSARSEAELRSVAGEVKALGVQALAVPADVRIESDCRRVIGTALEAFDRVDALINNAGAIEPLGLIMDAEPHAWETNWRVNLLGAVHMVKAALSSLRDHRGRIINVSSGAAVKAIRGWGAYSSAKAALNHFTAVLAQEEPAVTALAFRPGAVDTPMQATIRDKGAGVLPEEVHQRYVRYHEEGVLLPPEKPANSLAHLALFAPHAWSGQFIQWDEPRLLTLIEGG